MSFVQPSLTGYSLLFRTTVLKGEEGDRVFTSLLSKVGGCIDIELDRQILLCA